MIATRIATPSETSAGDVRGHPEAAEQHEQRHDRDHREQRAEEQRVADRIVDLLVQASTVVMRPSSRGYVPSRCFTRVRVALFITCFNDTLFPRTGRAVVALLERLGHAVDFPVEQTCCGQMHSNTGYQREAIPLVAPLRRACSATPRSVVSPSASCVGMVRDSTHGRRAGRRPSLADAWRRSPGSSSCPSSSVHELGVEDVGACYPHRVTYHPTCHSLRMLARRRRARCGCCARCGGSTWSSCPRPRSAAASGGRSPSRTPTPRWRCSATSCAACSTPAPRSAPRPTTRA